MEGARQITEAHIGMQLEASEIPIEGSPAAGLHDEPGAVPPLTLEPTPEALLATAEEQQRLRGGGGRGEGGTTEVQREQQRSMEGPGKGKGVRTEGRGEAGYVPRTPQRTTAERAEMSSNAPLFSEDQLRRFQDIYQKAPLIYPEEREAARRPEMREAEERSYRQAAEESRKWLEERGRMEDISRATEEARKKDEELRRLRERAAVLEMENAALKM